MLLHRLSPVTVDGSDNMLLLWPENTSARISTYIIARTQLCRFFYNSSFILF